VASFDWDTARYFLAAAREGSFAAAGRALAVKHTTVARQVAELERVVGAKLFRRTPDGLLLTEAATRIRPLAEEMERVAHRLGTQARVEEGVAGVVRLALSEAFNDVIVQSLGALRAAHPELVVDVVISDARADLARGEADVAIRMGPLAEQSLRCSRLGSFGWSLYAAATYVSGRAPLPWSNLSGCAVIGYDRKLAHSPGAVWLDAHVKDDSVVLRCNSILAASNAARAGLGVAALPCFVGAGAALVRVSPEVIGTRDGYVVLHPDAQHTPRVRAVVDHLREVVAGNLALFRG
jgi:DNA-binding transcriptional LysR family regulator